MCREAAEVLLWHEIVGQIVRRGARTWLVCFMVAAIPRRKKRKYVNQIVYGGLRDAQAHLNKMLGERDRGHQSGLVEAAAE